MTDPQKIALFCASVTAIWAFLRLYEVSVDGVRCPKCRHRMTEISYGMYDDKVRWECPNCGIGKKK